MASNKRLNATITIGGAITGALKSALTTTKSKLLEVGDAVRQLERQQRMLSSAINTFGRQGKDVDGLRAKYAAVTTEIQKQRAAMARLKSIEDQRARNSQRAADIRGMVGTAFAVAATAGLPIVQAAQFEKAMLGVAKQVDGARDSGGKLTSVYFDMAKQIQLLGRTIPLATNDLAEMVAAGARMGVAKDELIEFTRTAAKMASAFDLPAAELADQMGKVAQLFKVPIPAIGELADAINYLDDNAISKGGDIIEFLTRTGGVAAAVKVTGQQMAALGSTLLTLGERTETASTATNAMFQKFAAADKGTKKFKAAMKEIGLSTQAVQKGMQVDAQGTILKVLEAVNKLPKDKQLGVMVELVGLEHSDTLAKLANNVEEYRRQIKLATEDEKRKGSMDREFSATQATTLAQWQIFKNRVTEVSVSIGSVLLPALNSVMGAVGGVTSSIADFNRENPALVKSVLTVAGAFIGFGAAKLAVMGVVWAFGALKVAIASNPIGLAITLLAAGAALVYQNWEPIKAFFIDLWAGIKRAFQSTIEWIMKKLAWVGEKVQAAREFLGLGDGAAKATEPLPMAETEGGAAFGARLNVPRALPQPAMATARGAGQQVIDQSQYTFDIKTQPGQDNKAIADEVMRRIKSEQAVQRRGAMYDGANQ